MSHRHATIEDERDENNMSHCRKLFEAWKVISNERVVIPPERVHKNLRGNSGRHGDGLNLASAGAKPCPIPDPPPLITAVVL
jgi:hypothetical protein